MSKATVLGPTDWKANIGLAFESLTSIAYLVSGIIPEPLGNYLILIYFCVVFLCFKILFCLLFLLV